MQSLEVGLVSDTHGLFRPRAIGGAGRRSVYMTFLERFDGNQARDVAPAARPQAGIDVVEAPRARLNREKVNEALHEPEKAVAYR